MGKSIRVSAERTEGGKCTTRWWHCPIRIMVSARLLCPIADLFTSRRQTIESQAPCRLRLIRPRHLALGLDLVAVRRETDADLPGLLHRSKGVKAKSSLGDI